LEFGSSGHVTGAKPFASTDSGGQSSLFRCRLKIVWTTIVALVIIVLMAVLGVKPVRRSRRFDSLEQEVFLNLWRSYDRLRALEEELFSRYDLTPQQYNALRLLRSAHPNFVHTLALASQLVSRAADITRLLDKLEERGLIERDRPIDNRRVVRIGITAAGLALLRQLREPIRQCHCRQLGHLSGKELKELIALLRAARRPHEDPASSWR
jgi:DNA-binding MarR family transcriptional regulator